MIIDRSKHHFFIKIIFKKQVCKVSSNWQNIRKYSIIRNHEIMVDILSKYIIIYKPCSALVLKSKIMPNKLYIFVEEITKWGMKGRQQIKSTWFSRKHVDIKE